MMARRGGGWRWRRPRCVRCGMAAFYVDGLGRDVCTMCYALLQPPTIHGGGLTRGALNVNLGEFDVDAECVGTLVAEDGAQLENIAAIAQEINGECVTETVRMDVEDGCALASACEHVPDAVTVEGLTSGC